MRAWLFLVVAMFLSPLAMAGETKFDEEFVDTHYPRTEIAKKVETVVLVPGTLFCSASTAKFIPGGKEIPVELEKSKDLEAIEGVLATDEDASYFVRKNQIVYAFETKQRRSYGKVTREVLPTLAKKSYEYADEDTHISRPFVYRGLLVTTIKKKSGATVLVSGNIVVHHSKIGWLPGFSDALAEGEMSNTRPVSFRD